MIERKSTTRNNEEEHLKRIESISSSSEDSEEQIDQIERLKNSVLLKRFRAAVELVMKQNRDKKHTQGNCFTSYFFCHFNNLFYKEEIKERNLRPLPAGLKGKVILKKYDEIYKKLQSNYKNKLGEMKQNNREYSKKVI